MKDKANTDFFQASWIYTLSRYSLIFITFGIKILTVQTDHILTCHFITLKKCNLRGSSNWVNITFWYLPLFPSRVQRSFHRILHCITWEHFLFAVSPSFHSRFYFLEWHAQVQGCRHIPIPQEVLSHLSLVLIPSLGLFL